MWSYICKHTTSTYTPCFMIHTSTFAMSLLSSRNETSSFTLLPFPSFRRLWKVSDEDISTFWLKSFTRTKLTCVHQAFWDVRNKWSTWKQYLWWACTFWFSSLHSVSKTCWARFHLRHCSPAVPHRIRIVHHRSSNDRSKFLSSKFSKRQAFNPRESKFSRCRISTQLSVFNLFHDFYYGWNFRSFNLLQYDLS